MALRLFIPLSSHATIRRLAQPPGNRCPAFRVESFCVWIISFSSHGVAVSDGILFLLRLSNIPYHLGALNTLLKPHPRPSQATNRSEGGAKRPAVSSLPSWGFCDEPQMQRELFFQGWFPGGGGGGLTLWP